jgi:hypothetical protein
VDSSDRTLARVEQKNGHTIGSADTDAPIQIVGHQGVAFALPVCQSVRIQDVGGMDLAKGDIRFGIGHPGAEAMALPEKMLKLGATVNTVVAK